MRSTIERLPNSDAVVRIYEREAIDEETGETICQPCIEYYYYGCVEGECRSEPQCFDTTYEDVCRAYNVTPA